MALNFKAGIAALRGKNSSTFFNTFFFGGKVIDSSPYNRDQIVTAYETGIEVRTVLDRYVAGFASIPIKMVNKDGEDVLDDWRIDLLKNPNRVQTQLQFERSCALQDALFDEYFIHGGTMEVGLNKGRAEFLKALNSQYVSFEIDPKGDIFKYVNTFDSSKKLDVESVKPVIDRKSVV